jgi:CubicO group peptidase (beta-lactamase class C family)
MPFADVLRTRIFEPLGMRDTAFWTPDTGRLATAYVPTDDGLQLWDRAGRPLEQATDILRWSGRIGVDRRRHARLRAHAAGGWLTDGDRRRR